MFLRLLVFVHRALEGLLLGHDCAAVRLLMLLLLLLFSKQGCQSVDDGKSEPPDLRMDVPETLSHSPPGVVAVALAIRRID